MGDDTYREQNPCHSRHGAEEDGLEPVRARPYQEQRVAKAGLYVCLAHIRVETAYAGPDDTKTQH